MEEHITNFDKVMHVASVHLGSGLREDPVGYIKYLSKSDKYKDVQPTPLKELLTDLKSATERIRAHTVNTNSKDAACQFDYPQYSTSRLLMFIGFLKIFEEHQGPDTKQTTGRYIEKLREHMYQSHAHWCQGFDHEMYFANFYSFVERKAAAENLMHSNCKALDVDSWTLCPLWKSQILKRAISEEEIVSITYAVVKSLITEHHIQNH